MKILEIKDLTISFDNSGSGLNALESVGFSLEKGTTLGIVGESGSGKSVCCMSILRLLGQQAKIKTGSILYRDSPESDPMDILKCDQETLRKIRGNKISMIFQEPMSALNPVLTCGFQMEEILDAHNIVPKHEYQDYCIGWFNKTGIKDADRVYASYPFQLSGGQLQRVMISMALCTKPKILIADEPTTALDVTLQRKILELLQKMKEELGLSILFISHDLSVIKAISDHILVLNNGKQVEYGSSDFIFNHSTQPYTKGLIASKPPLRTKLKRLPTIQDFVSGQSLESFYNDINVISETELLTRIDFFKSKKTILKVNNLHIKYPIKRNIFGKTTKEFHAVNDVNFELRESEVIGLVGESGSGKSSIGKTITGLIPMTSGTCLYNQVDLGTLNPSKWKPYRKEIQIIFQDPMSSLNPKQEIGNSIIEPMVVHNLYSTSNERKQKAADLLESVGLNPDLMNRLPQQLSGGQRQRVCIARALSLNPKLLILDESVAALDVSVQAQVLNLLCDLKEMHKLSYIFITHDFSVVHFIADRILVLKDGKIIEEGPNHSIINQPKEEYTQNLIQSIYH